MASREIFVQSSTARRSRSTSLVFVLTAICLMLFNITFMVFVSMRIDSRVTRLESELKEVRSSTPAVNEVKSTDMCKQKQDSTSVDEIGDRNKRAVQITLQELSRKVELLEQRLENVSNLGTGSVSPWLIAALRGGFSEQAKQVARRDGRDGRDGAKGDRGQPGKIGPQGPPGVKGDRGHSGRQCKNHLPELPEEKSNDQNTNITTGAVYIRWGRTSCPVGTQLLYKGRIGGNYHTHTGGGSNHICLPEQPLYANYDDSWQYGSSAVYGAEYAVSGFNPFKKPLNNYDAPCAVCHVESRGSQLMIPGRYDCPSGWTREYWGYLMTKSYSSKGNTDFICVDEDAEYVPFSHADSGGVKLNPVQGHCYVLPCGPYVKGRELTCAVCSK